jgi:hypothetical protein
MVSIFERHTLVEGWDRNTLTAKRNPPARGASAGNGVQRLHIYIFAFLSVTEINK